MSTLTTLEKTLKTKRGYVFRMPPPGSPVILLLSGGLDSVISWAILLKEFQLKVYPVFLVRGEPIGVKKEKDAINYYASIYRKKYILNYIPPHELITTMPEFSDPFRDLIGFLHPQINLDNILPDGSLKTSFSLGNFSLFPYFGFVYARYLYAGKNIRANTIFCGTTFSDNTSYRSVTSARSIMLTLGLLSGEDDWQYTSVAYEPTIRSLLTKSDLIRWASAEQIPLDRAWTCTQRKQLQCGECLACLSRKHAFREAGIADMTSYIPVEQSLVVSMIKRIIIRLKRFKKPQKTLKKSKRYEGPGKSKVYLSV